MLLGWEFFTAREGDTQLAICNTCKANINHGGTTTIENKNNKSNQITKFIKLKKLTKGKRLILCSEPATHFQLIVVVLLSIFRAFYVESCLSARRSCYYFIILIEVENKKFGSMLQLASKNVTSAKSVRESGSDMRTFLCQLTVSIRT